MNAAAVPHPLLAKALQLLQQWKELTLAESSSIRSGDWDALQEIQERKKRLQPLIEKEEVYLERHLPPQSLAASRKRLRQFSDQLMELEEANRAILGREIASTDAQLKATTKSIHRLRYVQKAYGQADQSFWQSYS